MIFPRVATIFPLPLIVRFPLLFCTRIPPTSGFTLSPTPEAFAGVSPAYTPPVTFTIEVQSIN